MPSIALFPDTLLQLGFKSPLRFDRFWVLPGDFMNQSCTASPSLALKTPPTSFSPPRVGFFREKRAFSFSILILGTILLPMQNARADCNWGNGASTPQSVFNQSCTAQGGVPHGCSCDSPNAGGGNARRAQAQAAAVQQQAAAARQAQEAAAEAERQRVEQQRQEAARRKMQEEAERQAKFIRERDEAATSLKGSTGTAGDQLKGLSDSDASGSNAVQLKELAGSDEPALKGSMTVNNRVHGEGEKAKSRLLSDPMVVDARNVPSGLPKSVNNAIAGAYADAPAGVSDRVRKGFQAVATHDWILAKAWFKDALNHDPNNAGLKRLIELADYTEKHIRRDKSGKPGHRSSHRTPVQSPEDSDIQYLFPGWKPAQANPPSTVTGAATPIRHHDSTLELLFPGLPALEAKELNDYMFDQAIKMTENDPLLSKVSNRPGYKNPKNPHPPK